MIKKVFSFVVLCLLMFSTAQAQMQDPVHFSVSQKRVSPTEIVVTFHASIDAGWHVYSTDLTGGPTTAVLSFDKKSGVEADGKLMPGSGEKSKFDNMFNMKVRYFEGSCTFTQKLRITGKVFSAKGYLEYGACNDQNCMPPSQVNFTVSGKDGPGNAAATTEASSATPTTQAVAGTVPPAQVPATSLTTADTIASDTMVSAPAPSTDSEKAAWWTPVIQQLKAFGGDAPVSHGLLAIFFLGFLGGLLALFTPCVWPIIPMTVSFFMKRSEKRSRGLRDAIIYGISIIVIYVGLGLLVTLVFGASALNAMSTNAVFNIFFFLLLVVFAASFLGGFEITLPSSWSNKADRKADTTTGMISIFIMAFTLTLVSFSCTGPIIGFLLVEVSTTGSILAPTIGMLGFAVALALPFTFFALFPTLLKKAPKSGGWMNVIKVVLGFIELAFALKFLSVADLAYGWHLLDRETFLALWIVLFALLGMYLLGKIKFPHDDDETHTSVPRFFLGLISLAFALYMVPGLWGAPCKAVSAFAPPMYTQDFNLDTHEVKPQFKDFEQGMTYAKQVGKPVLLDFTGFGCVNCRKMEMAVWNDSRVAQILNGDYVLISLYVDDKTPLPAPVEIQENGQQRTLRTIGDKWSYLQRSKFGANAQPFYVPIDNEGMPLNRSYSFDTDVDKYIQFLQKGLDNYKK